MKRNNLSFALIALIAFCGCDNKQAKVDSLKAQLEPLQKRYQADCIDSVMGVQGADSALKGAPAKAPSPQDEAAHNQKCAQELSQIKALEQQMQAVQK
jgi:hypothetical protein